MAAETSVLAILVRCETKRADATKEPSEAF